MSNTPWWRGAVIYQIYPRSFADANGDGIGDLAGIVDHVDHLVRLGVDAVWLSPFYPSALADGGYDVDDYRDVSPQIGTLAGTIRTASRDTWLTLESIVEETVTALLAPLNISHSLNYRRGVPPVVNEEVSTRILTHAIEAIGPDVLADTHQSGGGEDFSWYLEDVPGAMGRLGVWSGQGPQLDLHQPTFDIDERALGVGVRTMVNIVEASA